MSIIYAMFRVLFAFALAVVILLTFRVALADGSVVCQITTDTDTDTDTDDPDDTDTDDPATATDAELTLAKAKLSLADFETALELHKKNKSLWSGSHQDWLLEISRLNGLIGTAKLYVNLAALDVALTGDELTPDLVEELTKSKRNEERTLLLVIQDDLKKKWLSGWGEVGSTLEERKLYDGLYPIVGKTGVRSTDGRLYWPVLGAGAGMKAELKSIECWREAKRTNVVCSVTGDGLEVSIDEPVPHMYKELCTTVVKNHKGWLASNPDGGNKECRP